jgi:hypothetical protein
MRPEAFRDLCRKRAARARTLAARRSEAGEALLFFAHVASFQAEVSPDAPLEARRRLVELVVARAPEALAEVARSMGETELEEAMARFRARNAPYSGEGFFARVLLQPAMAVRDPGSSSREGGRLCPSCDHPPQVGFLRRLGDEPSCRSSARSASASGDFRADPAPAAGTKTPRRSGSTRRPSFLSCACSRARAAGATCTSFGSTPTRKRSPTPTRSPVSRSTSGRGSRATRSSPRTSWGSSSFFAGWRTGTRCR